MRLQRLKRKENNKLIKEQPCKYCKRPTDMNVLLLLNGECWECFDEPHDEEERVNNG